MPEAVHEVSSVHVTFTLDCSAIVTWKMLHDARPASIIVSFVVVMALPPLVVMRKLASWFLPSSRSMAGSRL